MSFTYPGGIVVANPTAPSIYSASGIWKASEAAYWTKQGSWPTPSSIPSNAWISYGTISGKDSSWSGSKSITYDVYGNVYSAGYYNTGSANNLLFSKYNSSGVLQWSRSLTTVTSKGSISLDSNGNFYVAGNSTGTTIALAKYDYTPAIQFQKYITYSGTQTTFNAGIVDASGNSYVAGSSNGGASLYFAKIDSSGTLSFDRKLTGGSGGSYGGVALDSSGNIYVGGTVNISNAQFGLAKYDSSGTLQWQKAIDRGNPTYGNGVATDTSGNVFICGQEYTGGSNTGVLIKLNSSGAIQWQTRMRDATNLQDINFASVCADSSGNSYVVGYANYPYCIFIVKYDSSGNLQWQRTVTVSGSGDQFGFGNGINCDTSGNLYITGSISLTNSNTITLKLPSDGSATGTYGSGTTFTYAASSLSSGTTTFTASSLGWTASTPGLTTSAGSYTDSSQTVSNTKIVVV